MDEGLDEADADADDIEGEMNHYCEINPSECTVPEGAEVAEDSLTPCVPGIPCLPELAIFRGSATAARYEVAALWNVAKNLIGITARKLSWRVALAVTGFGGAGLAIGFLIECGIAYFSSTPSRPEQRFQLGRG